MDGKTRRSMTRWTEDSRPCFWSAENWLRHFEQCSAVGGRPWEPATRDELLLAEECGLLKTHPEWVPGRQGLQLLQLPMDFGRRRLFSDAWQERFLLTVFEDSEFSDAIQALLNRTPATGGSQCP